jgi:perosamine synthetase
MSFLKGRGIESRPFFYPLSSLPMFEERKENVVSYNIYERAINLPSYHELEFPQVERVADEVKNFLSK